MFIDINSLKSILSKLKDIIDTKSDKTHRHSITNGDITDIKSGDLIKLSKIIVNGDGTKLLFDDGTYKEVQLSESQLTKLNSIINNGAGSKFLSDNGKYLEPLSESQKSKINTVELSGKGESFLCDNGTYKAPPSLDQNLINKINVMVIDDTIGDKALHNDGTYKKVLSDKDRAKLTAIEIDDTDGNKALYNNGTYKAPLSDDEKFKISSIIIDMDNGGYKFLCDDGTYKEFNTQSIINDEKKLISKTYSSVKIAALIDDVIETINGLHTHLNKDTLDGITVERVSTWDGTANIIKADGDGESFLANNGEYVTVDGLTNPINNEDKTSITTALSAKTTMEIVTAKDTKIQNDLTIVINQKQEAVLGKSLSTNDYTNEDKDKVKSLNIMGDSKHYLAEDGSYYEINNSKIDDTQISQNATYSSNYIDKIINYGIKNIVLPTQNDAPSMWQRSFDNVKSGQVLEMDATLNYQFTSAIMQVFKHIEGMDDIEKQITNFTPEESYLFFYNDELVEFTKKQGVKIKNCYNIPVKQNENYYESDLIHKEDYMDIKEILLSYTKNEG